MLLVYILVYVKKTDRVCSCFGCLDFHIFVLDDTSWLNLPTFSGTRIKTRKRNIAAPLDPAAFADAVVQIYLDNAGDLVISFFFLSCLPFLLLFLNLIYIDRLIFFVVWICMTGSCSWLLLIFPMCRNLLLRALNPQTLTSQDTVTPFLRQALHLL